METGVEVERGGWKIIIHNLPEPWRYRLSQIRTVLWGIDLTLAIIGAGAALMGVPFGLPFVGLALFLFLLVEIGRDRVDLQWSFSFTSSKKTLGEDGTVSWEGPILFEVNYLDEDGNQISGDDANSIRQSDHVELLFGEGGLHDLMRGGEKQWDLPEPVNHVTVGMKKTSE